MLLATSATCAGAATPAVQIAPQIAAFAGTGTAGNGGDGNATAIALKQPNAVAADGLGNLYILDSGNQKVRVVDAAGAMSTLAWGGVALVSPQAMVADGSGNLYISDLASTSPQYGFVYKISVTGSAGTLSGTLIGTIGQVFDGTQTCFSSTASPSAAINTAAGCTPSTIVIKNPSGLALDASGNLYLADTITGKVLKVSSSGTAIAALGLGTAPLASTSFASPMGLALDGAGNLYVAEYGNTDIKKVTPQGVETVFAGGGPACAGKTDAEGDGCLATQAIFSNSFESPRSLAVDGKGNVYVSDPGNGLVRVIGSNGYINAVTGTTACAGKTDSFGDGCPAVLSTVNLPVGLAVDPTGNLYIADQNDAEVRTVAASSSTFPAIAVNGTTTAQPVYFAFNSPVALGSSGVQVVTQGATGLDFNAAAGGTCTAGLHAAGSFCTESIAFVPTHPGVRQGALLLYDTAGRLLIPVYLSGVGEASMLGFSPPMTSALPAAGATFRKIAGAALDGAGNLYVADATANAVVKIAPGGATASTLSTGAIALSGPQSVAVDGAGNVYIADTGNNQIVEVPLAGTAAVLMSRRSSVSGETLNAPNGLTVDADGNVYVLDGGNKRVVELTVEGGASVYVGSSVQFGGGALVSPSGIAIDGTANLYIADSGGNQVVKYTAAGSATVFLSSSAQVGATALASPEYVAVDAVGNVYVADSGNNRVIQAAPSGAATVLQPSGALIGPVGLSSTVPLSSPVGLAVDGSGNVYVADSGNGRVVKLDVADNPTLDFGTVLVGSGNTQRVMLENLGSAALEYTGAGMSVPADFAQVAGSGSPKDCGASTSYTLAAGAVCNLSLTFSPTQAGSESAYAAINDNALGNSGSQQRVLLTGTGAVATTDVMVGTSPAGLAFTVDGVSYTGAQTLSLTQGSHVIAVQAATQAATQTATPASAAGTQYAFSGWSDGGAQSHTINVAASSASYTASFTTQYQLAVVAGTGGSALPVSGGFYDSGTVVPISATAASGYVFGAWSWTSAGSGTSPLASSGSASTTVAMSAPVSVAAAFMQVPVLNFAAIGPKTYGDASFTVAATSASPGSVTYTVVSGPATVSGSSGSLVSITGAGTLRLQANQAASGNYTAATASVALMVSPAPLTVTAANATKVYGAPLPALSGTVLGLVHGDTLGGTMTVSYGTTATPNSPVNVAGYPIMATVGGTSLGNYAVSNTPGMLSVSQATPVVSWSAPVAITYGTGLSAAQLDATANVAGSFAYSPAAGMVLHAGAQTLSVTFTPTDSTDYSAQTKTVALQVSQAVPVVNWTAPAAITYGTGLSAAQLDAAANVAGSFAYSPAAGTVLHAGAQTLSVTFTPADSTDYSAQTKTVALQVSQMSQTIVFPAIAGSVAYGTSSLPLNASSPSGMPVSYAATGPGTVRGTTLYPTGAGTITVAATQAGNGDYVAAAPVSQTIKVSPLQLVATVTGASFTYGQSVPLVTGTLTGVLPQDAGKVEAVYSSSATSASAVGVYPVTVSLAGAAAPNYTVQLAASAASAGAGTVTVLPAPLNVIVNSSARGYGMPNPALSGTVTGTVNGDVISADYATSATANSPVGTYAITATVTGAAVKNYAVNVVPGTLTVNGAVLTVAAGNATRIYGMANPAFSGTITGQKAGDTFAESYSTVAGPGSNAGSYSIVPAAAGANLGDYSVLTVPGRLTVTQASTLTAVTSSIPASGSAGSGSAGSVGTGAAVTLTAVVAPSTAGMTMTAAPTGVVEFYDGNTLMGSAALVSAASSSGGGAGGVASATGSAVVSFATGGAHQITAVYAGNSNLAGSTSSGLAIAVVAPGYRLAASAAGLTLRQGESRTVKLTATPFGNYSGAVSFACSGIPAQATCAFSPGTVTLDGKNTVQTTTLTVGTLSKTGETSLLREERLPGGKAGRGAMEAGLFWLPAALLAWVLARRRRQLAAAGGVRLLLLLALAVSMLAAAGCNGMYFTPTPTGVAQVTVTATGPGVSQTVTFLLTVTK